MKFSVSSKLAEAYYIKKKILTIIVDVKWSFIVALICISLMTNKVEHLFMGLLALRMSLLGKHVFKSFAHLKNWAVCYFVVEL